MNGIPKGYEEVPANEIPTGYEEVPAGYEEVPTVIAKSLPTPPPMIEGAYDTNVSGPVTKDLSLMEAVGVGASNIVPSAARMVGGAGLMMAHPISTVEGISKIARGGLGIDEKETPAWEKFKSGLAERYGGYENIKRTLANDPVGLAAEVYGAGKVIQTGGRAAATAYRSATELPLETQIANTVRVGIEKGIRPSVAGKGNAPQIEKYFEKAQSAVESIIKNKDNLQLTDDAGQITSGLPTNLKQFSEAIDQTKRSVFEQYDAMVRKAGEFSITVNLTPVADELAAFAGTKVRKIFGGKSTTYAETLAGGMRDQILTPSEVQDAISILNERLKAFYRNPSPETATNAAADALAANRLRMALDSAIEGGEYQPLKLEYGALREIEKEVAHRAIVDARKNTKSLIDFADIASAAEAARAVATLNTGAGAAAVAIKGMKEWYKYLNNPNNVVRGMFNKTEKLMQKRAIP